MNNAAFTSHVARACARARGIEIEASSSSAGDRDTQPGRGNVGRQTFDAAHDLIRQGRRPTEAFAAVAAQSGRSAASVATAYYRVARTMQDGAGVRQRPRTSARPARGGSDTSELVRRLVDAAAALGRHVEQLERENAEYRRIAAALERLR